MGQPSYAPARTNVEISGSSSRPPSFRTDARFLRRGINDEVWNLPAAQQQGGALLVIPQELGLLEETMSRWETITLNHMSLMNITDPQEKADYMENLLGETAKLAWIQWRTAYEDEYKTLVGRAEGRLGTQNVISQVRKVLTLSDPVQGSTTIQDQAYRDLERLQCNDVKDMVKFLNDYMRIATRTGRLFIGPELSEKLWIKMPGDLGYKMKEEFDKAYPGANIAVIPRIMFAYKYLEARCKEAAFARSLKSVSFCRDIPIPGYYGNDKPKYTTRKARSYKGKPHETHVRIDRRKNLERTSHCKCYLCDEIGHFARDCPNPKRNVKRVAIFEGLNLPNECDIVAVEDNESDSEAIFSLTEGEGETELAFGMVRESVHMMTHTLVAPSWKPIVTMKPHQQACRHQWQDHQEIEAPGTDICLWCEYHIEKRARSHCPACLLTVCDICSKTHLGREVPPEAREWVSPFPDQTALIQQQQIYMNWADQDRARLKQELDNEKKRGQLLFEAERSRNERLGHEIVQQADKISTLTDANKLQEQQIAELQQQVENLKKQLREAQEGASNVDKGKGVFHEDSSDQEDQEN